MGSPVPSVVANLVMENIETRSHFCDHEEIKVIRILDTSEQNRKLHPIHNGKKKKKDAFRFWTSWLSVRQVATYSQQYIVSQRIQIDTSTLDQNTLSSINSQSLTLFSNEPKNFPSQPKT